jgi:hypothetical protein
MGGGRITVALTVAALAVTACGGDPWEEYRRAVQDARRCEPGDMCVVVGEGSSCTCPEPVNASDADALEALIGDLQCDYNIGCLLPDDPGPRCEDGVCVW